MLKVNDLRKSFLDFFKERGHRIVPSSSLLPKDDPTLLFTTAGMVQFKPMFAGTVDLEYTRAATIQKCLRTSDLENVGKTKRHLTFFEMLGNFSFGDYFKQEAIDFAWDYSINIIGFPREKIWVSIYENDDQAFEIWNKRIGIPASKIVRLGKKDNFWGPAGDSGACGPCSELYFDRGDTFGCGSADCRPGCECDRFLEYWNLVFNQFYQNTDGVLTPLPKTGIDTGMGLERLATLVQNVDSVYDTDEIRQIVQFVADKTGKKFAGENIVPISVIVEHARALTFAMSDGIYPSNDGRGYVLRRVLRRALRFSRQLGIHKPFIYSVIDPLVATMGGFYPEIKESAKNIKNVIESEEKRFLETLENGMDRLDQVMKDLKKQKEPSISGAHAFILYDTFGFPLEMTLEIALENGLTVDVKGYQQEMENQRERGKQSWKGTRGDLEKAFGEMSKKCGDTTFVGYEKIIHQSAIIGLHNGIDPDDVLTEGEQGLIILNATPFYGESGGQVGDTGRIVSDSGAQFNVIDTKKMNNTTIHIGEVVIGEFKKGEKVKAHINAVRRNLIRANHTATHLLQAALRSVLGSHVKQAGSLVEPDRLRFDFSHFNAMTAEEIQKIEEIVNEKIWEHFEVTTDIMGLEKAMKSGAMAVFDEKYEDTVRVISIDAFSRELCGGTHVGNTGQIGVFKIMRESSPGAGLRRIEAVTLKGFLDRFNEQNRVISDLVNVTKVPEIDLVKKIDQLVDRSRSLEKEIEKIKKENLASGIDEYIQKAVVVNGVSVCSHVFNSAGPDELRAIADSIKEKLKNSVVCFGSENEGKALLLVAATSAAVGKGVDSGKVIKEIAPIVGGGGGGRKDMAQAGGKNPAEIKKAIEQGAVIITKMLQ